MLRLNISGQCFETTLNSFKKTEVLTVSLRCIMCLNLNWIKSYDINHKCFWQLCFSILEEKKMQIWVSKMATFRPFLVTFFARFRKNRSIYKTPFLKTYILPCLHIPISFTVIRYTKFLTCLSFAKGKRASESR